MLSHIRDDVNLMSIAPLPDEIIHDSPRFPLDVFADFCQNNVTPYPITQSMYMKGLDYESTVNQPRPAQRRQIVP